jgi:hypothetical protein
MFHAASSLSELSINHMESIIQIDQVHILRFKETKVSTPRASSLVARFCAASGSH